MLPIIKPEWTIQPIYQQYLAELSRTAFSGEIRTDYASRLAVATDNSLYQVIPQSVLFPFTIQDIEIALTLSQQEHFQHEIKFCARGGGTSTNGQSLSAGIIVDCSKHMRAILELNLEEKWVRVQPGVILDQLNAYLRPQGYCFAPEISPSNRATIGGMVNTDAAGTGSRVLGRTHDHILDLTCVLANGEIIKTSSANIHEKVLKIISPYKQQIDEKFTNAPRTLNGYNLKEAFLNLNYLFCGSEGTLGVVAECKLKLAPIPKFKKVIIVKYLCFDDALRASELKSFKPLAVEAIDEKLIELARHDGFYFYIKDFIDAENTKTRAVNIVEFVGDDEEILENTTKSFCQMIDKYKHDAHHALGCYVAKNQIEEKIIWELRKKSVGLISKEQDGTRRPIPFIEDTAVPPEHLADYINEFKNLLNKYHLHYGMYGHVDAGCVHVRPALDMKQSSDEKLMTELSKEVVSLIEKYQGVLWGEHGQGYRSTFGERFFGKELYHLVRQIKTLFDPYDQMNPGKIATALTGSEKLVQLNESLRGQFDKNISPILRENFSNAMICNGNAACFNYATADIMCPSYKATQDRIHSPKGRATLMRVWLHQLSQLQVTINLNKKTNFIGKWRSPSLRGAQQSGSLASFLPSLRGAQRRGNPDFNHEIKSALDGCLGCKACVSQCPLSVDVPAFKAKFLAVYYQRYFHSLRDYLVGFIEYIVPWQAKFSRIINWLQQKKWFKKLLKNFFQLVDLPSLSETSLSKSLKELNAPLVDLKLLTHLTAEQKAKSVILLQDVFTTFYEPDIFLATYTMFCKLGITAYIAPYFPNGKPLHVKGFLNSFSRLVHKNSVYLQKLAELEIPIIGIDPSVTLTYRDEYQKIHPNKVHVYLLQEWLASESVIARSEATWQSKRQHRLPRRFAPRNDELANCQQVLESTTQKINLKNVQEYFLLSHCTERSLAVGSEQQWQFIFTKFGAKLSLLSAGCCGMAGAYGHELEHLEISKKLFNMDWSRYLTEKSRVLATGASCRSQVGRFKGVSLQHPIQALVELLG